MHAYILIIMVNYQVATIEFNSRQACVEALAYIVKDTKAVGACFPKMGGASKSSGGAIKEKTT